ncbi:hypothetical protein GCM10010253_15850 [Streptomyces badius]|uniref:Uncharacterized protein n=1 Tax=Streptomyces badius TaxID=1941 RepID=A0ABQ2SYZ7_STRBA|nr:hypothetical protein GCM10010253_15850 [Streptomyces badius]
MGLVPVREGRGESRAVHREGIGLDQKWSRVPELTAGTSGGLPDAEDAWRVGVGGRGPGAGVCVDRHKIITLGETLAHACGIQPTVARLSQTVNLLGVACDFR